MRVARWLFLAVLVVALGSQMGWWTHEAGGGTTDTFGTSGTAGTSGTDGTAGTADTDGTAGTTTGNSGPDAGAGQNSGQGPGRGSGDGTAWPEPGGAVNSAVTRTPSADPAKARWVEGLIDWLEAYWDSELGRHGLGGSRVSVVFVGPADTATTQCGPVSGSESNAFYCPAGDVIGLPQGFADALAARYGTEGAIVVLAREYAHNVQTESGLRLGPGRAAEVHADFLAGSATGWIVANTPANGEKVRRVVEMMGSFGGWDELGTGDHGTPAQRQEAFLSGYTTRSPAGGEAYVGPADPF